MTKKEASDKQEKMVAKLLGWKQVTGSGSRNNFPGDVSGDGWLGECKTHVEEHRVIFKEPIWKKIWEEATARFRYPAYFTDNGTQLAKYTWVIIPEREIPKDYNVVDYKKDVKTSLSFNSDDLILSAIGEYNVVYRFAFNTKASDLPKKRNRLLLMKLSTFEELLSC